MQFLFEVVNLTPQLDLVYSHEIFLFFRPPWFAPLDIDVSVAPFLVPPHQVPLYQFLSPKEGQAVFAACPWAEPPYCARLTPRCYRHPARTQPPRSAQEELARHRCLLSLPRLTPKRCYRRFLHNRRVEQLRSYGWRIGLQATTAFRGTLRWNLPWHCLRSITGLREAHVIRTLARLASDPFAGEA
ncbi:hypothetical protein MTO96_050462 [Rhipicephalus appendiculatus]